MDSILFNLGFDPAYLFIGLTILVIVLLVLVIKINMNLARLKNKYSLFMKGQDGKTLEKSMIEKFKAIDYLVKNDKETKDELKEINKKIKDCYNKIGIVKYDAFHEMGGDLSFALTMLDDKDNGWLINSMHSREGCYTYIKEIVKGESYIELSEEELESLQRAKLQSAYGLDIGL